MLKCMNVLWYITIRTDVLLDGRNTDIFVSFLKRSSHSILDCPGLSPTSSLSFGKSWSRFGLDFWPREALPLTHAYMYMATRCLVTSHARAQLDLGLEMHLHACRASDKWQLYMYNTGKFQMLITHVLSEIYMSQ